jgi:hypothetical protein
MRTKGIKKMTVDELARITQKGFTHLESQLESSFKGEFARHTQVVLDQFRLLNAEIKEVKTTLGPTVVIVAQQEKRIQNLESRLGRVERKVGIVPLGR